MLKARKIIIDQKKCIGCGTCAILASKTFKIDKSGKSEVINQTGNSKEEIRNAIDSCPVSAILWRLIGQ
jgi:ferredoxin